LCLRMTETSTRCSWPNQNQLSYKLLRVWECSLSSNLGVWSFVCACAE
jgi:hypothetical protein